MKQLNHWTLTLLGFALLSLKAHSQDMPLSMLLIDGEGWKLVSEGHGFTDAPCADDKGNFYFSDMRSAPPAIWKVAPDGTKSKLLEGTVCSGLKWGPDGRLYACAGVGKDKQIIAFKLPDGTKTVLAEDVQPNDLVVTHKGHIYFTETGKKQVTFLNPHTKEKLAVDLGITAPNGLTLSPDQGTLAVSDSRGQHVWALRIQPNGTLAHKEPYMTLRTEVDPNAKSPDGRSPVYKVASSGDGMTSDRQGRYYVASAVGVQVFDPTGRMSGVLPKPSTKFMTSCGFGGPNMDVLYVTCADQVFARKTKANGNLFFLPPPQDAPPAAKKK